MLPHHRFSGGFTILTITNTPNSLLSIFFPPPQARIKAINTFFGKNGFRSVDSSVYSQHAQPQTQYGSPVYMQQMYSPQQQYPVYPVVSPTWNPSVIPYFETPLVSFSHSLAYKIKCNCLQVSKKICKKFKPWCHI